MLLQPAMVNHLLAAVGKGRSGLSADQRIAVCGTHRSGTTLLGRVLAVDRGSRQIFEPFNPGSGIAGLSIYFVAGDWPGNDWPLMIDRFFAADSISFRSLGGGRLQWLTGTRLAREYAAAMMFRPRRLVLKAPFLSLSSRYLIDRHDVQVVFTVKHPAAFFVSLQRVGWGDSLPFGDLVDQGVVDAAAVAAAPSLAARAGLFWNIVNRHALQIVHQRPDAASIWSHERFCRGPDAEMAGVANALRIDYSPAMRQAVNIMAYADVVRPPPGTINALERNAAALADDWRDQISSEDERELRTRCSGLYGDIVGGAW